MKLVNVGFNNMVSADRIVVLAGYDCAPSKRLVQEAKKDGRVIDCTVGKKTKTVIVTDSGHVILSAQETEKLAAKIGGDLQDDSEVSK